MRGRVGGRGDEVSGKDGMGWARCGSENWPHSFDCLNSQKLIHYVVVLVFVGASS